MIQKVEPGLFLGDRYDAEREDELERRGIEAVVTVMQSEVATTTEHVPLADGTNDQHAFDEAVDAVRRELEAGSPVLIHCAAGRSRSPVVIATALAVECGDGVEYGLARVRETGRYIHPAPALLSHARDYLAARR